MSTDPDFAPIDGVDLDGYARANAAVAKAMPKNVDDAAKAAETTGIPAAKWPAISEGWSARLERSEAVREKFVELMDKY